MVSLHKKNILITGATGYLAGRIFQSLEKFNLYHFIFGCRDVLRASSIDFFAGQELRTFDIAESSTFVSALKGIDIVIHLASMNAQDSQQNPQLAQKINVDMVQKLIEESCTNKISQFVYMSTFHVYGPNVKGLITESTPVNPENVYAQTHFDAEKLLISNSRITGHVIRLSNAIGAPLIKDISAWKLVANDLCKQAIKTKKMILLSTGDQKRDFVAASCIGDAIHALVSNLENKSSTYNLGSERTMSILEMAELIQKSCRDNLGFTPQLERKIDPLITADSFPMFTYSNERLRSLGFKMTTSLEDEIKKTLKTLT